MSLGNQPTVREFRDAAVRAFSFLQTDYAFRVTTAEFRALSPGAVADPVAVDEAPGARIHDGVVALRLQSAEVAVEVGGDPRMEMTCQLYRLATASERIDLFHIRVFVGAQHQPLYRWGHATLEQILTVLAGTLARHGGPWLRGDRDAWEAILQWWAKGMPDSTGRLACAATDKAP